MRVSGAVWVALVGALGAATPARAQEAGQVAAHVQGTFVVQTDPAFSAPYDGPNSLDRRGDSRETADLTLYAGGSPWRGAEIWANPEVDQGFGLHNTTGAAGFPSGEAYKVGKAEPYVRLQRLFLRQTINLGGERTKLDADLNQLGGEVSADRLVLTVGKFGVGDVFDTNAYAHDPRHDFLNWTLIDSGAFDYAADAWGYSVGGAAELYEDKWAIRAGLFNLSVIPNGTVLELGYRQYEAVGEVERRFTLGGHEGRVRVLGWFNHGEMGRLDDALAAAAPGTTPDVAGVRRYATRAGGAFNVEQELTSILGVFARASVTDGRYEAYEFTDVDRSAAAGLSLKGAGWGRKDDRVGLGAVVNGASAARQRYLAAGGLGILVGDGQLPHPGAEAIGEGWYDLSLAGGKFHATADAQVIGNPAYNRDRGPVAVFALRLHAQI